MIIVPFEKEHLTWMFDYGLWNQPSETLFDDIIGRAKPREIFTALDDKGIYVIGGVCTYWKGVGEAWAIYTKDMPKHRLKCIKATQAGLDKIIGLNNFHRIQAACSVLPKYKRFLEAIGFTPGQLLKKYNSDKTDSILYEIVA